MPPKVVSGLVRRSRLLDLLDRGEQVRLALVVGPAGAGKTMLLADWLAARPERASAWLSCDAADADPARFAVAIIEAARYGFDQPGIYPDSSPHARWRHKPARCGPPSRQQLARVPEVEPRMLKCVAEARAVEEPTVAAQDLDRAAQDLDRTAPLKLRHRICPAGEAVVELHGELDIASGEVAVSYVRDIIQDHADHGPGPQVPRFPGVRAPSLTSSAATFAGYRGRAVPRR